MKWSVTAVFAVLLVSALPLGASQEDAPLLEDDVGDVEVSLYDQSTSAPSGMYDAVDLVSLDVVELPEHIRFIVGVAGFPSCDGDVCQDSGDTRTHFDYGDKRYEVQAGININGFAYGMLWEVLGNDFNRQFIAQLDNDADAASFTYTLDVPREHVVDGSGAPPRKDASITGITTKSYSQVSFGGPDPDDPQSGEPRDMLVTADSMGDDAPGSITFTLGGVAASGDVQLTSPTPYRASNGGEGTFRYDLQAVQREAESMRFRLEVDGAPDSWTIEKPAGQLELPSGTPGAFSILVTTPFGHQHGGTEAFDLKIVSTTDPDVWASVELGMHYVAVPQPSGHHPTMWFHTTANPEPFATFSNTLGGANGQVFMNTLEEDGGDEQAPVQGWTSMPTNDLFRWAVCMQPELRMGIDMNMSKTGTIEIPLQSTRGYDDVLITGRVKHLGPGDDINSCFSPQYSDREQTEIATIGPVTVASVGNTPTVVEATVTPLAAGDYLPFEEGSLLVVEFEADPADILPQDNPTGPESLSLTPGGLIVLPLDEYHDSRPQGLVSLSGPEEDEPDDPLDEEVFVPEAETKDAPVASVVVALPLLAAVAAFLRRS